jgi:hypothetical protein
MVMGEDPSNNVLFLDPPTSEYEGAVDDSKLPMDPEDWTTTNLPVLDFGTNVPCAIEFSVGTNGLADPSNAVITILDSDWSEVSSCIAAKINGKLYTKERELPTIGLFSIGVHQVEFKATDI